MSVPDTNTFSLQDVVDEVVPQKGSLQGCFDAAVAAEFDPAYEGNKDRLSNFRNYGTTLKWIHLEPYPTKEDGYIWDALIIVNDQDQATWDTVHDHTSGYGIVDDTDYKASGSKRDIGGGDYDMFISRVFLSYNLTLIYQTIIAAKILIRMISKTGEDRIEAGKAPYGSTLEKLDYSVSFTNIMTWNTGEYTQGDSSTVKVIYPGSSAELTVIDNSTGNILPVSIKHHYDWFDTVPSVDNYVKFWRDGSETGDYVWKPQLRLQYSGDHMLEISNTSWDPGTSAGSLWIYLVASEGNNWDAVVSAGDSWLTVSAPTSDDGTRRVKINVSENTGSPRVGTVTFESSSADKVITVSQAGVPECYATPDPYAASYDDHDKMFQVVAYPDTNAWTASFVDTGDGIDWISFVGGNTGTGDGSFTVNVDDNDGPARSCGIKLVSDAPDDTTTVNQAAGGITAGILEIDNQSNNTDSTPVDVTPDSMDTTTSKDSSSWFKLTSGTSHHGDFTLSIELFGTPPTENKIGYIYINDDDSGISETVTVYYSYLA